MRLVVGIAQILIGACVLALNGFWHFQRSQFDQAIEVPPHDIYYVQVGWEYYVLYTGVPLLIVFGGWLLIRDHRFLAKKS
ncbi:hypothetical protein L5876_09135 [Hyphobacterium sp. SN044]|uniref:hypothetical protein n=1 Tax=Hyphobacterium sp. SN044 TaxID=2912575 RepID=UPI001F373756|nr:hypothetical protein [Hyphobacterium sp. SN044]MCF8879975.1 hypothetical protein [Hyphobacterium sp. SN044]